MNMIKKHYGKVLAVSSLLIGSVAHAALSPEAQAAVDSVSTTATDFLGSAWSIAIIVVVGFAGIKLFKKAVSKAT